ncbi:MAG: hypothetical protein U1E73_13250 [Planctomycetota bacterium]
MTTNQHPIPAGQACTCFPSIQWFPVVRAGDSQGTSYRYEAN